MAETMTSEIADESAILADLRLFTRRWAELGEPCWLELRTFGEQLTPQNSKWRAEPGELEEAAHWAASMNALARNVYAVRNPIRDASGPSANDGDILAAFYLWADCDDDTSAGNIRTFTDAKVSAVVRTGSVPGERVHTYWELAEPIRDLAAWRRVQEAIASRFGSDRSVVNASRIMRVAGTICWPDSRKRARGYVPEPARMILPPTPRDPMPFDRAARIWPAAQPDLARPPVSGLAAAAMGTPAQAATHSSSPVHFGTAHSTPQRRSDEEMRDALRRCAIDGEKHGGVRDLSAMLAARGADRVAVEFLVRSVCPVWDRNVESLIDSAFRKFAPVARDTHPESQAAKDGEREAQPLGFAAWQPMDLASIPRTRFVYADFYARGYTSLTIAEPKRGKSMLALAEALDMATGRGLLTGKRRDPQRVFYYNAEDDQNVINNRVAALLAHYDIPQSEIAGRLYVVSGIDRPDLFLVDGEEGEVREDVFQDLETFLRAEGIDVAMFDPLQDLSNSPETNEVFRRLGRRLRQTASALGIAMGLVHHTRKVAPGMAPTIDDARGGSALRGTARFNRVLVGMTEDEALKAGVPNHRFFVRIGDMESNLAPPSADVNRWFQKISVETPNGEHVGALEAWSWPDPMEDLRREDAARVRAAVAACGHPLRRDVQARDWVGHVVAGALGLDLSEARDKQRVREMIRHWLANGVLAEDRVKDAAKGREYPVIVAGPTDPMDEADVK